MATFELLVDLGDGQLLRPQSVVMTLSLYWQVRCEPEGTIMLRGKP
jgi:hypothetical protein